MEVKSLIDALQKFIVAVLFYHEEGIWVLAPIGEVGIVDFRYHLMLILLILLNCLPIKPLAILLLTKFDFFQLLTDCLHKLAVRHRAKDAL